MVMFAIPLARDGNLTVRVSLFVNSIEIGGTTLSTLNILVTFLSAYF